jgi:hypothetical protein
MFCEHRHGYWQGDDPYIDPDTLLLPLLYLSRPATGSLELELCGD